MTIDMDSGNVATLLLERGGGLCRSHLDVGDEGQQPSDLRAGLGSSARYRYNRVVCNFEFTVLQVPVPSYQRALFVLWFVNIDRKTERNHLPLPRLLPYSTMQLLLVAVLYKALTKTPLEAHVPLPFLTTTTLSSVTMSLIQRAGSKSGSRPQCPPSPRVQYQQVLVHPLLVDLSCGARDSLGQYARAIV